MKNRRPMQQSPLERLVFASHEAPVGQAASKLEHVGAGVEEAALGLVQAPVKDPKKGWIPVNGTYRPHP